MKNISIVCDRCNEPNAAEFDYKAERKSDAAGSMEDVYIGCDLCSGCAGYVLRKILAENHYNHSMAAWLRKEGFK